MSLNRLLVLLGTLCWNAVSLGQPVTVGSLGTPTGAFFRSPLTDVTYTLTVRDQFTGATRAYTNGPGSPGQLCGGVDTSAFAQ